MSLIRKVVEFVEDYCRGRGLEYHIGGTLANDDIYMVRYFAFRSKYLTVYIHRFLRSDAEDHHDHPFNFISYMVDGAYTEEILTKVDEYGAPPDTEALQINKYELSVTRREAGSFAFRPARAVHRVIVDQDLRYADRKKGPLTVIVLGHRFRVWGFWKKTWQGYPDCKEFVKWYEYLNVDPDSEKARKHQ